MKTFSPPFFCCLCRGFYFLFFSELAAVFPHSFRVSQPPISFYRFLLKRRPFSFLPFSSEHFYFVLVFPLFFIPQAQTGILNSFFFHCSLFSLCIVYVVRINFKHMGLSGGTFEKCDYRPLPSFKFRKFFHLVAVPFRRFPLSRSFPSHFTSGHYFKRKLYKNSILSPKKIRKRIYCNTSILNWTGSLPALFTKCNF